MGRVRRLEHLPPCGKCLFSLAVVNHRGGQKPDAPVVMFTVIPVEEPSTETVGILLGAKAFGKLRPILQCLVYNSGLMGIPLCEASFGVGFKVDS